MSATNTKYINIVVEDILSEILLKKVIERAEPAAHDVTKRYSSQKRSLQENKISTNNTIENAAKHLKVNYTFRRGGSGIFFIKKSEKY